MSAVVAIAKYVIVCCFIKQMEKRRECEKLSSNKYKIDVKQLAIPSKADWLNQFAVQSLSTSNTKTEDLSSCEEYASFMHDIKCLEYSHTPLNKTQLLTSAFRKSELVISKLKINSSKLCGGRNGKCSLTN